MAEHAGPGTLEGSGGQGYHPASPSRGAVSPGVPAGAPAAHETFHGRPASWLAVSIIILGFILGGVSLIAGFWVGFWAGVAVAIIGGIVMLSVHAMDDWY